MGAVLAAAAVWLGWTRLRAREASATPEASATTKASATTEGAAELGLNGSRPSLQPDSLVRQDALRTERQ